MCLVDVSVDYGSGYISLGTFNTPSGAVVSVPVGAAIKAMKITVVSNKWNGGDVLFYQAE